MRYKPQADYGTPLPRDIGADADIDADAGAALITLSIDGRMVSVPKGTSIMRAAALSGGAIPKLCATDSLQPFGSCRMCLVEIEGRKGTPASCTTPAEAGMVVRTESPRLHRLRRGVMELYISDHPLDCLTCSANNDCELQDMAAAVGLRDLRYGNDCAGHLGETPDSSNPYFLFAPDKCIVCSRCVRACDEVQGTLALSVTARGFASRISAGAAEDDFLSSECVSCGACVAACPTSALMEKSVKQHGKPERAVVTTCAYCGVGCALRAELKGEELVRMVPWKEGKANHGHACVKGRFAWGYAHHPDRITRPMIREEISAPWREVGWEEALGFAAERLHAIRRESGPDALGAIASSRCTNEETYLVQKLVRAVFGTNNVDTCARVCHSPTGYGLAATFGTSAGTQDFDSVDAADVILIIGANPTDAHPVFGSHIKQRVRAGAKLIVIDPRRIDLVQSPHIRAAHHLALAPGTNVAVLTAMAHVIVTEGLADSAFIAERCEGEAYEEWASFVRDERRSPEVLAPLTRVPAEELRAAARLYATAGNGAIYYGLGVTEHSQGSSAVIALANLAMATGNIGRPGVGVNPMRGQNNVQGSCDMGSFPHQLPGYRHVGDEAVRRQFEAEWQVALDSAPGLRINNMFDAAIDGVFRALYVEGEDLLQSDPNTSHVAKGLGALDLLIVHDLFLNETASYAHVFLPGSTFLEKDGTFTNAERRIQPVRKVMSPAAGYSDWEVTQALAKAMGADWAYEHPSEILAEIARLTPSFAGVSWELLCAEGSLQWPVNAEAPAGTPVMHKDGFVRGKGRFIVTDYIPTDEKTGPRFPLLLTTGRILSQYNVGAQTRRTANSAWHEEDVLEMHPVDAENRGLASGDLARLSSRAGATTLRVLVTDRVAPGVVYTTFHHPETQANVVTTEYSDWATNCPEYKVTAVQVTRGNGPAERQRDYRANTRAQRQVEGKEYAGGEEAAE